METQVYQFSDARDYLREVLKEKQKQNPSFSLRAWARQLGLQHHALLAMTLTKKRKLKSPLAFKLRDSLALNGKEARYFEMLVAFNNAESTEEKDFYARLLRDLSPSEVPFQELTLDSIQLISQWHHSAILEMVDLQNFNSDPQWIASRLGDSVQILEVEEALKRLERLGLIEMVGSRYLRRPVHFVSPDNISNEFIKKHHRQMIERAQRALENQSIEKRDFRDLSMSIRKDQIPLIKKKMKAFIDDLAKELSSNAPCSADEVYQLNLQFFSLLENAKDAKK